VLVTLTFRVATDFASVIGGVILMILSICQPFLLGFWVAFGTIAWPVRALGVVGIVAALVLASFNTLPIAATGILLPSGATAIFVAMVLLPLRFAFVKLEVVVAQAGPTKRRNMQFSITDLLLATFFVAVLMALLLPVMSKLQWEMVSPMITTVVFY